jgi:hypothetical protein
MASEPTVNRSQKFVAARDARDLLLFLAMLCFGIYAVLSAQPSKPYYSELLGVLDEAP